jgi:hypothetical protein
LLEKMLEVRRRILGEEHPDTLTTMNDLAWSYSSLGRTKEAAELQEKVLEATHRIGSLTESAIDSVVNDGST